jgi:hypothetical protein
MTKETLFVFTSAVKSVISAFVLFLLIITFRRTFPAFFAFSEFNAIVTFYALFFVAQVPHLANEFVEIRTIFSVFFFKLKIYLTLFKNLQVPDEPFEVGLKFKMNRFDRNIFRENQNVADFAGFG